MTVVVWERHYNGDFELSVLHVSLCVESGDVVCKQRRYQDENTALTQLFFRAKQTSKRIIFRTAGVIQRATRDVKREERIAGSRFRGWMNIKLSIQKLAYFGFFPHN